MLRIDNVQQIQGVTVYGDDQASNIFYVVAEQPRFRLDAGKPVLRFLKYRFPIDREDGKKGGGFVAFDTEFVVPEATLTQVTGQLQEQVNRRFAALRVAPPPVKIAPLTYTKGTSTLLITDENSALVQKVRSAGKPSLVGRNISCFLLELTPEGATFFEQALQGERGFVQVVYDLNFWAKLPPVTAHGWFHADKFYSFFQDVDVDNNLWSEDSYQETIREQMTNAEARGDDIDFGGLTDEKIKTTIRDYVHRSLDDAIARNMLQAIAPESHDVSKIRDEGSENIRRDIQNRKITDVNIWLKENQVVEWWIGPRGTLPNITTLKGPNGKPLAWKDYSATIDLDDPFFKQIRVNVQVNADFEKLPLHSIEVKLDYKSGSQHQIGEYVFKNPNDVNKFASFIENDVWKYKYSYQVNYKGESRPFVSPIVETDDKQLVISVDDLGFLVVDIAPGDLNFTQVPQTQVTVQYEDKANGVPLIEREFTLDKDHPNHSIKELIFQPRRNPYRYRLKYFMADGKEYEVDWKQGESPDLYINDPFGAMRTIGIRAAGDLERKINTIFFDIKYVDDTHAYSQTKSGALSKAMPFLDWTIPVIDDRTGKIVYSGTINFKDGTEEEIPETETTKNTIQIGQIIRDMLEIQVVPDLIDFDQVKLAKVSLHYADSGNGIDETKDLILKKGGAAPAPWVVELKDKSKTSYEWQATFFMNGGAKRDTGKMTSSDPTLVLEVPG